MNYLLYIYVAINLNYSQTNNLYLIPQRGVQVQSFTNIGDCLSAKSMIDSSGYATTSDCLFQSNINPITNERPRR